MDTGARTRIFSKSLSQNGTPSKVPRYSQSLCSVPSFRSPTGDVVLVVVDVAPIWMQALHGVLVEILILTLSRVSNDYIIGLPHCIHQHDLLLEVHGVSNLYSLQC